MYTGEVRRGKEFGSSRTSLQPVPPSEGWTVRGPERDGGYGEGEPGAIEGVAEVEVRRERSPKLVHRVVGERVTRSSLDKKKDLDDS